MTATSVVRHHSSVDLRHACSVEASIVSTSRATEVYARLAPIASATSRNACALQSRVLYDALDELLHGLNAQPDHVILEKAYFRNLRGDYEDFDQVRREFYRRRGLIGAGLPAITRLGQAPCQPAIDVEMQIYAVIPTSPEAVRIESLPSPPAEVSVKLVEVGRARHLYVSNVTGQSFNGSGADSFRQQIDRVFGVTTDILAEHGARFDNVLRSWIYLADIDADYAELNASRNAFFAEHRVTRPPASTGIGATAYSASTRCAMDTYALLNPEVAQIEIMSSPALNEASEYGSAFSRGIKMALPESTYLFISATPSIDATGKLVAEGDARGQYERMLLNVEELLQANRATWNDLTHAVTYLKSPGKLDLYEESCGQRGLGDVPHTIVSAALCRPELLCELEAVAVIPTSHN